MRYLRIDMYNGRSRSVTISKTSYIILLTDDLRSKVILANSLTIQLYSTIRLVSIL